jgi:hypothetical protein
MVNAFNLMIIQTFTNGIQKRFITMFWISKLINWKLQWMETLTLKFRTN